MSVINGVEIALCVGLGSIFVLRGFNDHLKESVLQKLQHFINQHVKPNVKESSVDNVDDDNKDIIFNLYNNKNNKGIEFQPSNQPDFEQFFIDDDYCLQFSNEGCPVNGPKIHENFETFLFLQTLGSNVETSEISMRSFYKDLNLNSRWCQFIEKMKLMHYKMPSNFYKLVPSIDLGFTTSENTDNISLKISSFDVSSPSNSFRDNIDSDNLFLQYSHRDILSMNEWDYEGNEFEVTTLPSQTITFEDSK